MSCNEGLQLADELRVPAEIELGRDPLLDRTGRELREPVRLGSSPAAELAPLEGLAAPQRERLARRALPDEQLEALGVELAGRDVDDVALWARLQPALGQRLPEPRDVHLHCGSRGRGRRIVPERLHELPAGDDAVRAQEEDAEQQPLLGTAERQPTTVVERLDRTQHAVLHLALV
jgi:hypothetical protein